MASPRIIQLLGNVEQVLGRSSEPIGPGDHHHVVVADVIEPPGQLGTVAFSARRFPVEGAATTGLFQRGTLQRHILIATALAGTGLAGGNDAVRQGFQGPERISAQFTR